MGNLLQNFNRLFMATVLASAAVLWSTLSSAESVGVVYHIDDAKNGRFALHLAEDHLSINPDMQIAVVTYAAGVDFLLKGAKDKRARLYEPDVQALMEKGVFTVMSIAPGVLIILYFDLSAKLCTKGELWYRGFSTTQYLFSLCVSAWLRQSLPEKHPTYWMGELLLV